MIKGGVGGASTRSGILFERGSDLRSGLSRSVSFSITEFNVFRGRSHVGTLYPKARLYSALLGPAGVDWTQLISKRLLPDDAILVHRSGVLTIIEQKFQACAGSVDEKLQTCGFKLRQYRRLVEPLGYSVQFAYVLSDWFKQPCYRDTLEYVEEMGCSYFFDSVVPLEYFDF